MLRDGTGYTLTRNGPGDVTEQWRAPEHDADHVVDRALELADRRAHQPPRPDARADGRALRRGAEHAGAGRRRARRRRPRGAARRAWRSSSTSRACGRAPGLVLYENLACVPDPRRRSRAPRLPVDSPRPNRAALGADLSRRGAAHARRRRRAGTVLWGEAYDSEWQATGDGDALRHERGVRVGQRLPRSTAAARCRSRTSAQWQRWALLGGALVIWLLVVWRWRRTRVAAAIRRRARRRRARGASARERRDPLADVLDDDAFWWERV